jgi:hypothetical protein
VRQEEKLKVKKEKNLEKNIYKNNVKQDLALLMKLKT